MAYPNHDPYSGLKVVENGRNTGQPPMDGVTSSAENLVYDENTTHKVNKWFWTLLKIMDYYHDLLLPIYDNCFEFWHRGYVIII